MHDGHGMGGSRVGVAVAMVALMAGPGAVAGQERGLGEPTAVHGETFAVVNTVRELPDGRVFVADPLARVFVALSRDLQTADTLGRLGEGPQEYRQPDAVWPLPGDRTLLVDLGNSRLTTVGADGRFGDTRPIAQGAGGPAMPPTIAIPGGIDGQGRIYFTGMPAMGPGGPSDTVAIVRLDVDGSTAPVTRVKTTSFTSRTSGGADNQNVSISPIPLSATDVWAVAPDGSVAVARAGEARVDWIAPDGTVRRGTPLRLDPIPIRQAEKEEWAADRESSGGGIGIQMTVENGRRAMSMSRGGQGGQPDLDGFTWPDAKAPWVAGSGRIDPSGRFWVRRSLPAGEPALYDVFDGGGARVDVVRLASDRDVVGFGAGSVYVVHVDPFDLKTLERYTLPTS